MPQQTYYIVQQPAHETGDHAYNETYSEPSQTGTQTEYKFVTAVSAGGKKILSGNVKKNTPFLFDFFFLSAGIN